jgi:hypothetical protein
MLSIMCDKRGTDQRQIQETNKIKIKHKVKYVKNGKTLFNSRSLHT